jgi:hypothetical protein
MFKKPFTQSKVLFLGSILLPYLLDFIPPHSAGSHNSETLLLDFTALVVLGISSLVLALSTPELRSNGKGLIYPAIAFTYVSLYLYSLDVRIGVREQVEFLFHKSELEAHAAQSNESPSIADSSTVEIHPSPSIIFYCTEGEASIYNGGYAYSPTDEKPLDGNYYEWRKLSGHWYRWKRSQG